MRIHSLPRHLGRSLLLAAGCTFAVLATPGYAADAAVNTSTDARYQQERARCLSGQSGQAQATCLKEAGAAKQQGREGQLTEGSDQNAKKRCDLQSGDARKDCLARANGTGMTTTSGSVKSGGVLKETTTTVPAPAAAGASAAP